MINDNVPQVDVEIVDEETQRQQTEERLQAFGATLAKQRDEWVRDRRSYGVDKRWVEDEDQYNGKDNVNKAASQMMTSVEQGYPVTTQGAKPARSTVFIGLTRQKTNAAEARLADILLPTDDRNWGIDPTPEPHLMGMAKDNSPALDPYSGQQIMTADGQPAKKRDIAKALTDLAAKRAESMQRVIDDQLTECDYNGELRKLIHFAAVLGTGVVKGPIVESRTRKAWKPYTDAQGVTVHQIEIVKELDPASFNVDPRNCFPDPSCGEDIHDGKGMFERHKLTAKQVRELAKQPGYMKDQLRKVLEEGPKRSATMEELRDEDSRNIGTDNYEMWEYWGEIDKDDLKAAMGDKAPAVEDDELKSFSACVIMINSTVVKVYLNPLEDGALPYDFFVWEKVSGSVWGYGVPYLMRSQQRVLNSAWRMMMDNAGVTARGQVILNPTMIQPADKQWQITAGKLWYSTADLDDVRKAFSVVEFNNHQAELAGVIKMAMELSDQESGVPTITQGEKGAAPDTVGGMQMLMNSANVVLRRLVKQFDDQITRPHIRRYYDYNMMYNDDESIKGDFSIQARGSSALLVRDIQNQSFLNLLAAGSNPVYGIYLDTEKLFKKALQAQHIDPAEVFKSDEEIEQIKEAQKQGAQQQPDPRIVAAQIRAQSDQQKVQAQNQGDMAELQTRLQISREAAEIRMAELQLTREIEMLKMANQQNLSLEQIKAKLADTAMRERGKKELFAAEQNLKLAVGSGV
jgi:hypothetical protein